MGTCAYTDATLQLDDAFVTRARGGIPKDAMKSGVSQFAEQVESLYAGLHDMSLPRLLEGQKEVEEA